MPARSVIGTLRAPGLGGLELAAGPAAPDRRRDGGLDWSACQLSLTPTWSENIRSRAAPREKLAYDQDEKASLYALAGVPEYWIVNLRGRQVEVHRQPRAGRYTEVVALGIDDHVTPLISVQQIFEGI